MLGGALVALHVLDLLVVAECAQVIGIGDVATGRMKLNVAVQRADGLRVMVLQVLCVALHELGFCCPGGIGIVLLDQVELVLGGLVALAIQGVEAVIVQLLHRLRPARPLPPERGANRRRHSRPAAAMQVPAGPSGRMRGEAAARSSKSAPWRALYQSAAALEKVGPAGRRKGGSGGGHQWEHLVRVQQPAGIEGRLDAALLVQFVRGELHRHQVALLDADAVLAGQAAAHLDAEFQDVGAEVSPPCGSSRGRWRRT